MRIGVIDSGVGGLTVLKSLLSKCPNHEYIYYGDTIHLPYGEKSKDEIVHYANNIINFLEIYENVDLIVIACGTISSNIEFVKSNKRLIDIISPLENKLNNYKKISVIATPLSVKTNAFKKYINSELNLIACSKLVPIIENDNYSNIDNVLKDYLKSTEDSEALILGCTHYPLVKNYIKRYFNKDIICLDDFVVDIIKKLDESKPSIKLYFSFVNDSLYKKVKKILNVDNIKIERMCLND